MFAKLTNRIPPRARGWARFGLWMVVAVIVGLGLAMFVVRTYSVSGISMEPTLHSGDLVLASKIGRTVSNVTGQPFVPNRGDLAVFKNPFYNQGDPNLFVVKRVIGLPGDRVVVHDGRINVFTASDPTVSFNPDTGTSGPQSPTSGAVDRVVPENELFVAGDNRLDKNSLDSRNGMSTIPLRQIEGVIVFRVWPFTFF